MDFAGVPHCFPPPMVFNLSIGVSTFPSFPTLRSHLCMPSLNRAGPQAGFFSFVVLAVQNPSLSFGVEEQFLRPFFCV